MTHYPPGRPLGYRVEMTTSLSFWASGGADQGGTDVGEPLFDTVEELRAYRKRQAALAYRLFAAFGWGVLGDGHISVRDPQQVDAFWLLKHGVAFNQAKVSDLVLVGPEGRLLEGEGTINMTAYYIHAPVHEARPDVVCAAHTHTAYGTPWAANVELFQMICQEATAFFEDHTIFDGEEVNVMSVDVGKRIAAALGDTKATILGNHGPLTVGSSVGEAIGWFLTMERVAEVHVKAHRAKPISDEAARLAAIHIGAPSAAVGSFEYAIKTKIPDQSVVD